MQIAKWSEPFRLDSLDEGWDDAPRRAGVYVVYNGKTIQRAGGPDKKGILYIGRSAVLRNRLWGLWYVNHPASWFLWTYPKMASLILDEPCNGKDKVCNLVGTFNVTAAAPIPKGLLNQAERAAMHAYCLCYGELPPLNFSFPMKWLKAPSKELLRWGEKMLD
jgi:hypothetical protein